MEISICFVLRAMKQHNENNQMHLWKEKISAVTNYSTVKLYTVMNVHQANTYIKLNGISVYKL